MAGDFPQLRTARQLVRERGLADVAGGVGG